MFIGQYEHSVDQKGRFAIPSKFRKDLGSGAVITKGLDGCLFLFTSAKWRKMAEGIGKLPVAKASARQYARLILSSASEVEFDSQGRILIPQFLREYSGISSKAIVTGLYDRIEVWDKASWKAVTKKIDKQAGEIAEELSELGI
jgi:MraZ protein